LPIRRKVQHAVRAWIMRQPQRSFRPELRGNPTSAMPVCRVPTVPGDRSTRWSSTPRIGPSRTVHVVHSEQGSRPWGGRDGETIESGGFHRPHLSRTSKHGANNEPWIARRPDREGIEQRHRRHAGSRAASGIADTPSRTPGRQKGMRTGRKREWKAGTRAARVSRGNDLNGRGNRSRKYCK